MPSEIQTNSYRWIDTSEIPWIASGWGFSHIIVAGIGLLFYIFPGLIFIAWVESARRDFDKKLDENRTHAFRTTGCTYLASFLHTGGHPGLPYKGKVLIGLKPGQIEFYTYDLKLLTSAELKNTQASTIVRNYPTASYQGQNVVVSPDTVILSVPVKDQKCEAEFYTGHYDPLEFMQFYNKMRITA